VIHSLTGGIPRRINTLCNRLLLASFLAERHTIAAADVQAVAHEMAEELGPEVRLSAVPVVGRTSVAAADTPSPAHAEMTPMLLHFDRLEERIDRLERTVAVAVDLLHRLLQPDKPANKSGTSSDR
jgi:general secretion pathway protein A